MSKYQKTLIKHINTNPQFILPHAKKNEILTRLKEPLKDLSISRTNFNWGIPLPNDNKHHIYVWFDALINYLTTTGFPQKKFENFWPADTHLIGRDITWHHTIIWGSMLMSAQIPLPKTVFSHGFINAETGEKMSKSKGNIIDPLQLAQKYPTDAIRYYLIKETPFGEDGNFSINALEKRINYELADELGNLVYRTLTLIEKNYNSKIPNGKKDKQLFKSLDFKLFEKQMHEYKLHNALETAWTLVRATNKYITEKKPWEQKGKEKENTIFNLAQSLKTLSIILEPFLPQTSKKIAHQLGFEIKSFTQIKEPLKKETTITKEKILFEKIQEKKEEQKETTTIPKINFSDKFKKLNAPVSAAIIQDVTVKKKKNGLETLKKKLEEKIKNEKETTKTTTKGYKKLYQLCGIKQTITTPAERLKEIITKNGKLPRINTIVDSYNLVSTKTGLLVGAHDLSKIEGNTKFEICNGTEKFIPLNSTQTQPITKGEYAFMDEKEILCRLDIKQCEKTKITENTKHVLIYVQGNPLTNQQQTNNALKEITENINRFCGGKTKIIKQ
jgi:DNA/RNA-binding domain of Phe-tRNA-synthetase-like protein